MSPQAAAILRRRGLQVEERPGLGEADLLACIGAFDGLAVRSATKVTAQLLAAAGRLRVIGRAGIGVDNIDVHAATQRGVVVMNTPDGNAVTTAEHTVAMLLALVRQIPRASAATKAGRWEKSRYIGMELTGKTLGIVGCGKIGAIVADRALGLRMKVVAHDPWLSDDRALKLGVERVDLDDLFGRADIVSLHTPLTDQTRGLVDAAALARMRPGVRIVNCARGALVDEAALAAALKSGHVAGAALDVFAPEPPAADNPLLALDNVVCTPHLGAATAEAQTNVAVQVAEQISDFLLGGAVVNALNMPAVSAEEAPRLAPWMRLAEQLGRFAGQLSRSPLQSVRIDYQGQAARLNCQPLTASLLYGLLSPAMGSAVNMVNAPAVARDRGIAMTESLHDQPGDYQALIGLRVGTERQVHRIAGSLFAGRPRLVTVNGVAVEAEMGGHMLYINNRDQPGLIGAVGSLLGDAGVNIASFYLGRDSRGGAALALVTVDSCPPAATMTALAALPGITRAQILTL